MLANATSRRPNRWHVLAVAVAIVAIGALAVGDVLLVAPTTQPTPTATPTTEPSATPAAEWAPLELSPLEPVATLKPSAGDDAGIAPDATFALGSLTDEPASALAERLEITPPTEFSVVASTDGGATITPAAPLAAGDTYRVELRTPDGALAASWAFHVRGPVNVVSTIPGDATVGVPVRTGIEVTFDQEGVADMADHFSIEPAVRGTFERHGRTQVFVPSSLAPATTYTVTIGEGLARTGTDLALPTDVVFRFETEGPVAEASRLVFGRDAIETGPDEAPMIAIRAIRPWLETGRAPAPTTAAMRVYRFPSIDAASRALAAFLDAPRWTEFADPLMPTDGLVVVDAFEAPLEPLRDDTLLLRYPTVLPEGAYVLELQGDRPAHALLQVTPVSAWVTVLSDRTVVWVNDVTTHGAVDGATVAVERGRPFAASNADGLAIGNTPKTLLSPPGGDAQTGSPILRVTSPAGDVALVPFNVRGDGEAYRGEWWEKSGPADESYWAMLYTDRGLYRRIDRIETWGYLRGRDDGQVPAQVVVRLVASGAGRDADAVAVASVEARPGPDGAFTASLPIAGLPIDSYEVQALVDGRVVISRWVDVSVIRKPPYRLELMPDHLAVIAGASVNWTAAATFFDGTPVPSLDLVIRDDVTEMERHVTTDAAGRASLATESPTIARSPWATWWAGASPQGPESAEISAYGTVVVFPSADYLDASGVVEDGRVRITGDLIAIDFAEVERQLASDSWDWEPSGTPAGGRTIQVAITELVPIRRQVGSEYDFIEKVVRPVYEYDYERVPVRTLSVESAADGRVAFSSAVPDDDHQYEVVLTARDDAGRVQERTLWVRRAISETEDAGVTFVTDDDRPASDELYGVGDRVAWRMVDDGRELPSGGVDRYLYLVAQRGLRSAAVTDMPRFGRTYAAADAPGIFVIGVRFTGSTYAPKAAAWADFDETEREIRVHVTADRAAYRPGETATLSVRTTSRDGKPVAATIVLQAVDEKLYAMYGAVIPRPLSDLYRRVDSGIVRLTATHQVPSMAGPEGEGGDTTGGGERSDFKDTLLFRELRTDATGRATATVRMSDDLTSWHVTASAVTRGLTAGVGELLVPVGLPFFVELTVTNTYHVSDRPVLQIRAFGDALQAGDPVEFAVAAPSLGLANTRLRGTAFTPVGIELPALSLGTHAITATATATTRKDDAGRPLTDGLARTFEVVASRLTATRTAYGQVETGLPSLPAGAERSVWTFTDAGRGRLVPVLTSLADPGGLRIDRLIAQSMAADTLISAFGRDPASLAPSDFDPWRYPIGAYGDDEGTTRRAGVGILPYGSVDPWLAARIALTAPDALQADVMRDTLVTIRDLPTSERDLQIAAIAALAALGEPVLGDLQEAGRQPDLTSTELLYLALGFEAAGDDPSALAIERDLLARHGEALGAWVRLGFERTDDGADATALLAVVAAGLGDPLAANLADYAWSHPARNTVDALELAAYATRTLERTPAANASFAYTVEGHRTVVALEPGEAFSLPLTAAQVTGLSVETLSGQVGAAVEARVPVAPASLVPHPGLTLTRDRPDEPIPTDEIVEVNLTARFGPTAPDGCYDVREFVPSGLAPMTVGWGATDQEGITWPSSVVGQEVRFCVSNDPESGRSARLRYIARVVNTGTFAWEPAVMQLPSAPELLAITPAATASIGTH